MCDELDRIADELPPEDDFVPSEVDASVQTRIAKKDIVEELVAACNCALADLQGLMPDVDPSGNRKHPGWITIKQLEKVISMVDNNPGDVRMCGCANDAQCKP